MRPQEHVVSAYARIAPVYYWVFGWIFEGGRAAMGQEIARLKPRRLLEIGVGTGIALRRYPPDAEIHGIDICPQMLERARAYCARLKRRSIHLELMDAELLEFQDASFDCVTIPYVLSVTDDPARLIREARRVCKPGGTILVLNHFSEGGIWQKLERLARLVGRRAGFHARFEYDRVIGAHDWRVLRNRRVNFLGISRFLVIQNVTEQAPYTRAA